MEEEGLRVTVVGALLIVAIVVVATLLLRAVPHSGVASQRDASGAGF